VGPEFEAKEALKSSVQTHIVPVLRQHGFKGSMPTWRRANARGDVAIANIQLSSWNTRSRLRFYINLAGVPEPWVAWNEARLGRPRRKQPNEADGLFRDRLEPPVEERRAPDCWTVSNSVEADEACAQAAARLEKEGLLRIEPLLDRATMLETLRSGSLGMMPRSSFASYYMMALAVLLSDDGKGSELTRTLKALMAEPPETEEWARQRVLLIDWVRARTST
jgi:hypothetical protein